MTVLFIQTKTKTNLLVLKAITGKEKTHLLIDKKDWKSTLISEAKTCYLYVNKESEDYNFHSIYNYFTNFASNNERNLNIDIQSFISKDLAEGKIIQAISEGILFGTHQKLNYKKQEKKKQTVIII